MANIQDLIVVGITLLMGAALGYWFGRSSGQTEARLIRERIGGVERDRADLASDSKRLNEEVARLTGELGTATASLDAEKNKYEQMKADLETAFGDAAARALGANNVNFLTLAKQELGGQAAEAGMALEAKELAIKNMLLPLQESLKTLNDKTQALEVARAGAYGTLEQLVADIKLTIPLSIEGLKKETAQLITALRSPKIRGNWGELQLRRCVEYAGMIKYCSFMEQVSSRTDEEKLKQPDMVIQLPNGRRIVVDSKTPLDAFLDSADKIEGPNLSHRFSAHALRVRTHLKELAAKTYWEQFEPAPEFVVCFLPSEALFSAALEAEPSLIEFSPNAKVIMATPTTLIALLKAVAYGWQQSEITQSAAAIQEAGKALYTKLANAHEHLSKLGSSLNGTMNHYNKLVGSVEGRGGVFYYARRLGDLVHSDKEIEQLEAFPAEQRVLVSDDWVRDPGLALAAESDGA
jgi:DNA recombination protein RmuC